MNTCLKGYVNLWVKASHRELPPCHVWWPWCSASGDIKYLIWYVTSQKYVIEGSSNFMSGTSS